MEREGERGEPYYNLQPLSGRGREGVGDRSDGRESEMGELQISFLSITKEGRMEGWKGTGWGIGCRSNKYEREHGGGAAQSNDSGSAPVGDGAAASFYCRLHPPSLPLPISGLARRTAAAEGSKTASEQVERI